MRRGAPTLSRNERPKLNRQRHGMRCDIVARPMEIRFRARLLQPAKTGKAASWSFLVLPLSTTEADQLIGLLQQAKSG